MRKTIHLYLIKPSQYDDDGYVVRHWRGVLPSNTLACLAGLTEDAIRRNNLDNLYNLKMHLLDETVDKIPVAKICRSQRWGLTKAVVCLVGVQTNQFPRACDLAHEFRKAGVTVMIGGFHVSGYLALLPQIPPDIQALMDAGVAVVKGEVEETWSQLLLDAIEDRLQPMYDFLNAKPDLYTKPIPVIRKEYLRKFVASNFGTLDCGRGCPFECTFCTIINVQGRKMRYRSAGHIAEAIRHNYEENGITFYFFTDDNFARNKNWEAIFDEMIKLRTEENIPVAFMMQVDVLSWKIKNFVSKARQAGCMTVFIGMESVDPGNLAAAGKKQNHVNEYKYLIQAYREVGISSHVGYILGFPFDTVDSIRRDLRFLTQEVQPDHASFFILTPLPGSMDHIHMMQRGEWMDPDFNLYDSHHEVTRHPYLRDGSWKETYFEAWKTFYSLANMKAVLQRGSRASYWNNFLRFIWYKNSIQTEGRHPMMCGYFRLKGRKARRPGLPILSRWEYYTMRAKETYHHLRSMVRVLAEMEELTKLREKYGQLKLADLQTAYLRAKEHFPTLRVPSKVHLFWAKWSPLLVQNKVFTRADLQAFWTSVRQRWDEQRWFRIPIHKVPLNALRDAQLSVLFLFHMARGL
jgi:radical SAM superfamily enzyme YgiQ (UPF0313 family)